jgi:hypothetical protein
VIEVTIIHPNGQRENLPLAGIPRIGEHIRRASADAATSPLVVEHVLYLEWEKDNHDPVVLIAVRPHQPSPPI